VEILSEYAGLLIPLIIVVIVVAALIALMLISRNYIKVSPNQAAVLFEDKSS
jgi:uncharacterized membrane protein YqiK